jgi:hypothetical protein
MRPTPPYCPASSNCSATSYHSAATIDPAAVVGAPTAILIIWITVATTIISAGSYNGAPSNNRSASDGRAPVIHGTTSTGMAAIRATASVATPASVSAAAPTAGPNLHNLGRISRMKFDDIFRDH